MSLIDIDSTNSLTVANSFSSKNLPRIFMPFTNNPQPQSVNFSYRANEGSCAAPPTDFPQLVSYGLTQQSSSSTMSGLPIPNGATHVSNGGSSQQQQQQPMQTAFNSSSALTNYSYNPALLNMDDKAFDNVVFDILKVDPDDIAGQLTLIDLPLFKQIQPDELISCKWMSREKLVKAPNIVQFTRRFNQTTFWCQKEILNCKRIETRGKMITIFIKIAKRLNELHSFNSLMAIIVALKGAPIYRLKKTWSQYVSKRDTALFERLSDIMLDTNDNKRKMRDTIMNCKLPCIPFLGLFLTDLIHIDIAHPHNSFDNPQRRNQMNNICRLISEYQQSNYQDLTSISCNCCFTTVAITEASEINANEPATESKCLVSGCGCLIHHGTHKNGSGIINNDGTIYINDIGYIKNYLNSFLYIEELQKFKEEENYRDSLELEPEPNNNNNNNNSSMSNSASQDKGKDCHPDKQKAVPILHVSPSSPGKLSSSHQQNTAHNHANNNAINGVYDPKNGMNSKQTSVLDSTNKNVTVSTSTGGNVNNNISQGHRKSQSVASNLFNFSEPSNHKHPLDESIEANTISSCSHPNESNSHNSNNHSHSGNSGNVTDLINEIPLTVQQQKQLLANVKINDPSSLLRELLKHRHNNNTSALTNNTTRSSHSGHTQHHSSSTSFKNKLYPNCISNSSADADDDSSEDEQHLNNNSDLDEEPMNNSISMECAVPNYTHKSDVTGIDNSTPIKPMSNKSKKKSGGKKNLFNSTLKSNKSSTVIATHVIDLNEGERRLSGRNLICSRDEDNFDSVDAILKNSRANNLSNSVRAAPGHPHITAISKTSSSSDLFSNLPNLAWNTNPNNEDASSYTTTTNHDLSGITNLSNILTLEQQFSSNGSSGVIIFESPVRRKCIMKHSKKPRFSQWKNYWLQLIGGNLLIYYPMKAIMFNPGSTKQRANCEQEYIEELVGAGELQQRLANGGSGGQYTENADIHQIHQEMQQQQNRERLHAQLQLRKSAYNKNPCKMHPIANWMVVNLYQDKEDELIQTAQAALHPPQQLPATTATTPTNQMIGSSQSTTPQQHQVHQSQPNQPPTVNLNAQLNSPHFSKFDIQLNDLTTSTMYKFRFDGLQLAKEWLEQFKLASTYHERQNQDNLIRFD